VLILKSETVMQRICFLFTNSTLSGGSERVGLQVANELYRTGQFEVHIINLWSSSPSFFEINCGIRCTSIFSRKSKFIKKYFEITDFIRMYLIKNKIDILINVDSLLTLYSLPATKLAKTKNICWEQFNFDASLGVKLRLIARYFSILFCDRIVTLTESDRQRWIKFSFDKMKIKCIPNPCAVKFFDEYEKTEKQKKIIAVGRLELQKGFDLLLKAWFKSGVYDKGWCLNIIGNGSQYNNLKNIINQLNIEQSVSIESETANIENYYSSAYAFCLSSRYEGFGLVLIEAETFGLPIVAFNCKHGPSEIIEHNKNGFLVECENVDALADALSSICNLNSSEYNSMSQHSKFLAKRFELNEIIPKWFSCLDITN